MECSKCHSKRVVTGSILDSRRAQSIFAPDGLRFAAMTVDYGTKIQSFACLDCGLVWLATSPKDLEDFVRKHCDQRID